MKTTRNIPQKLFTNMSSEKDGKLKVLEWSSQLPDLNPIEPICSILDRKVRQRNKTISNISQLLDERNRAWAQLDKGILKSLVHSMPDRCKAVIQSKGSWTKYMQKTLVLKCSKAK